MLRVNENEIPFQAGMTVADLVQAQGGDADILLVNGPVSNKLKPALRRLYDQMPAPKWVMAMGNCAISGGPFYYPTQYAIVPGADLIIPVDVYVPGCPPRPETLIEGILLLEEKITKRGRLRKFRDAKG